MKLKILLPFLNINEKDMDNISSHLLWITIKKLATSYMLEQAIALRYFISMRNAGLKNHTLLKIFL